MRPSAGPGAITRYTAFGFPSYFHLRLISIHAMTNRAKCEISNNTLKAVRASVKPRSGSVSQPCLQSDGVSDPVGALEVVWLPKSLPNHYNGYQYLHIHQVYLTTKDRRHEKETARANSIKCTHTCASGQIERHFLRMVRVISSATCQMIDVIGCKVSWFCDFCSRHHLGAGHNRTM